VSCVSYFFLGLGVDVKFALRPWKDWPELAKALSRINLKIHALDKIKHDTLAFIRRTILAPIQHN